MEFSKKLTELMTERGISNYKLAKSIGVHATTIKNWKTGTSPTISHVKKLSEYFSISLGELI